VTDVHIANFTARITRAVIVDDGIEERRSFDIDVTVRGVKFTVSGMPADEFASLDWVIPNTMGRGRVACRMTPRVRDAIQYLSGDIPVEWRYGHLGWRKISKHTYYLHAGGAIGKSGSVPGITVALSEKFTRFVLPDPSAATPKEVRAAVTASLRLLRVAPRRITAPLLCGVLRAPLGTADFSTHLTGPSGSGKTVIASLAQQHWGAGLDWQNCPGSWSSTANANEGLRSIAKDTLVVLDDLAPGTASARDIDRTFRGQGNASGRDRMASDSSLRATKPPRGSLLSTGEDSPFIYSAAARTLVVSVGPNAVKWSRVTASQQDAAAGRYALTMAAYVRWLAPRYDEVMALRLKRVAELRAMLLEQDSAVHRRTPGIIAELTFALEQFLAFALDVEAVTDEQAGEWMNKITAGLGRAAAAQAASQHHLDPVARFKALLIGALTAGRAHVANKTGTMPLKGGAWGWHQKDPGGDRIGWVDGVDLYLDREAAYRVLAAVARETNEPLLKGETLWTRLYERGLLVTSDLKTKRQTHAVRRVLDGARRQVLHLHSSMVLGENDGPITASNSDEE
jgi:hypothetical protein